jgi:hypothetical protein
MEKTDIMKTKVLLVLVLAALITAPGFSQEKTKKELKEERKIEKQKQTEAMVNSKEFLFTARTAMRLSQSKKGQPLFF